MNKKFYFVACLLALIALLTSTQTALAHEHIEIGDYELVIGWANEPPVAGQMNAITIAVSDMSTGEEKPVEDISGLMVILSYGGQTKALTFEPLGEDAPGQFHAPVLPTIAGQYTLLFGGQLGNTPVDAQVEPEEVAPADAIQFPILEASQQESEFGLINTLLYFSLLVGLIALILAVMAFRKAG
jgi:hypothetical protein